MRASSRIVKGLGLAIWGPDAGHVNRLLESIRPEHEAAHAVVAATNGVGVKAISVRREDMLRTSGHEMLGGAVAMDPADLEQAPAVVRAAIDIAGLIQNERSGVPRSVIRVKGCPDYDHFVRHAPTLEQQAEAEALASKSLDRFAWMVEKIAVALREHGALSAVGLAKEVGGGEVTIAPGATAPPEKPNEGRLP